MMDDKSYFGNVLQDLKFLVDEKFLMDSFIKERGLEAEWDKFYSDFHSSKGETK